VSAPSGAASDRRRIFFVAGEASGDAQAAHLAHALRARAPEIALVGVGGAKMRAAGVDTVVDVGELSVMGISEVVGALARVIGVYRRVVAALRGPDRPDLVVLVDSPDFNLRVARAAKRAGVKVFYYVSPQVWAWRERRVRQIRERVDAMVVLFPFEEEFYARHGVHARFFGNPLAEDVCATRDPVETRARYGATSGRSLVALLPGSRAPELRRHLPLMLDVARSLAGRARFVIARAPGIERESITEQIEGAGLDVAVADDDTYDLLAAADAAVMASGTATVESALLGCPAVVVYRMSGLSYRVAKMLVRTRFIAMPNILLNEMVYPELIQSEATSEAVCRALLRWLDDPASRDAVRRRLGAVRESLVRPGAAERAAAFVLEVMA
jgi:lipid-A-disaccharide synthase